jgi:DNA invertase Pin-like site-specific DNA recombinase
MDIGYARVSTHEQNLDLQLDALKAAGCEKIFTDEGISGMAVERDGLSQAISAVGPGDVLVVWKLDRLGRSLGFLIELVGKRLRENHAGFKSLSDHIDTTSPSGKLFFHMMGALAEFERDLISERTKAGMQAAKRRGKHIGRPLGLTDIQIRHAQEMRKKGSGLAEIGALFNVHPKTVSRALKRAEKVSA